jgi:small multidrug resistance pump
VNRWILLGTAIVFELAATLALRASHEHRGWLVVAAIGYVSAFAGLTLVLRTGLAIGVAYGIWGAVATAGTAALAAAFFGEPLTWPVVGGIALIIVGVMFVELGSQPPKEQPT